MSCPDLLTCPAPTAPAPCCLLCIEDNPVNGLLLQEYFGRLLGLSVQVAATGAEGLALARGSRPMALLLDLMLPDMSGLQVLAQLRADPRMLDLPVVVISGQVDPEEWAAASALGAISCWPKPLDLAGLRRLLQRDLPEVARHCIA